MEKELKMFPEVRVFTAKTSIVDMDERYQYQCPIIMRYLKNKIDGWNICDFIRYIDSPDFALYAVTEFADLVCKDMNGDNEKKHLKYICDRNAEKFKNGYLGLDVVSIDTLVKDYKAGKVKKVLICNVFYMNDVFDDLMKRGIALEDLISISSAVFSYSGEKVFEKK